MFMLREDGRAQDEIRLVKVIYDVFGYADASVLFEVGKTKVLVSATLQSGVPHFLKGTGSGWLTAEYAMLPASTRWRGTRDSNTHRNSRSVEISRLIGRSLRTVVNLKSIKERSIIFDCDVLQADGGTRVACITAASLVLVRAQERWLNSGIIEEKVLKEPIAAISAGFVQGRAYLDLSQDEDGKAESDFNFVLTKSGNVVEIQGTSEKTPLSWENFLQLRNLALKGIKQLFGYTSNVTVPGPPIFSIKNRQTQKGAAFRER
jgi:ribonuclease PH